MQLAREHEYKGHDTRMDFAYFLSIEFHRSMSARVYTTAYQSTLDITRFSDLLFSAA